MIKYMYLTPKYFFEVKATKHNLLQYLNVKFCSCTLLVVQLFSFGGKNENTCCIKFHNS